MLEINISMFRLMFMDLKEPVNVKKYGQVIGTWTPAEKEPPQDKKRNRKGSAQ